MIPRRKFHDDEISVLGIGGHHLGETGSIETSIRIVHEAIDAGVNFFDNCWEYCNGRSELWLGRALRGRRDRVFLMTKVCTHGRDASLAMQMLDESLRRLGTDHLDLWQLHGMCFDNDPQLAFRRGGAIEALEAAKKSGKVRYVGFSGHKHPSIHLKMLSYGFPFDTVQMPLNAFDAGFRSFQHHVLPELARQGIAALGMKSLGGHGEAAKTKVVDASQAIRYAMSLPVLTTITGIDNLDVLHQNLQVADNFTPMTSDEMRAFEKHCAPFSADGRFEPYKVSLRFDNPEARMAHGFPIDDRQIETRGMISEPNW